MNSPMQTKFVKLGGVQGLIAPKLMGLSQYFHTSLVFGVSNGASLVSIACSVLEIWQHEFTYANQIHETWLTSGAHSSKSDGVVTP